MYMYIGTIFGQGSPHSVLKVTQTPDPNGIRLGGGLPSPNALVSTTTAVGYCSFTTFTFSNAIYASSKTSRKRKNASKSFTLGALPKKNNWSSYHSPPGVLDLLDAFLRGATTPIVWLIGISTLLTNLINE